MNDPLATIPFSVMNIWGTLFKNGLSKICGRQKGYGLLRQNTFRIQSECGNMRTRITPSTDTYVEFTTCGVRQNFQFSRQNTWFFENNRALFNVLNRILHYLISITKLKKSVHKTNFYINHESQLKKLLELNHLFDHKKAFILCKNKRIFINYVVFRPREHSTQIEVYF